MMILLELVLKLTKFAGQNKVPVLEWFLAWTTAVVFGIRYLVDYAKLRRRLYLIACRAVEAQSSSLSSSDHGTQLSDCVSLCPLAHTRAEMSVTIDERWERLRQALMRSSPIISSTDPEETNFDATVASSRIQAMTNDWTDKDWIQVFHSSLDVRRETSYIIYKLYVLSKEGHPAKATDTNSAACGVLLSKIRRLWPQFLELPESVVSDSIQKDANHDCSCDISLIVPMYREKIGNITSTLNRAFRTCRGDKKRIQVVVVHVQSGPNDTYGDSNENSNSMALQKQLVLQQKRQHEQRRDGSSASSWGELKVVTVPFGQGKGRGNTLNIGAKHATAPILAFLHADTVVPVGWDEEIRQAFTVNATTKTFPHACAFTMAIDDSNPSKYTAAGLLGAEWLGVLRCHCGLPYGDSVLSFGRPMFDYMGGYPEQPLMEDYEVMDWLRLRTVLLNTIHRKTKDVEKQKLRNEGLVLLSSRAKCSPRRWQKYGVAYTSLINCLVILRYRGNATAEDLFDFYYHCNVGAKKTKRVY